MSRSQPKMRHINAPWTSRRKLYMSCPYSRALIGGEGTHRGTGGACIVKLCSGFERGWRERSRATNTVYKFTSRWRKYILLVMDLYWNWWQTHTHTWILPGQAVWKNTRTFPGFYQPGRESEIRGCLPVVQFSAVQFRTVMQSDYGRFHKKKKKPVAGFDH